MVLTTVTGLILASASAGGVGQGLIGVLLFLPLVQLAASVLTLFWISIRGASFPDKTASLRTLGKITLWSFLGALAGAVAMIVGFTMLS